MWIHGNQMVKPTHSLAPPSQSSEYAEVTQMGMPVKINPNLAPPEPYATVTLKRNGGGAQSDDSCVKCSASPSSSEYNAPMREPINICDMLPPPPDHPYGSYKPPNNMTIRTNPAAMSPQVLRRIPPTPPRWGTLPPPIPNFPQNWIQQRRLHSDMDNNQSMLYSENDYESGSVLYEQCCRGPGGVNGVGVIGNGDDPNSYFSHGGEPTEEYYRNVNMEFFEDQDYEPSTPPPPCPDTHNKLNTNLRLLVNNQQNISPLNSQQRITNTLRNQVICQNGIMANNTMGGGSLLGGTIGVGGVVGGNNNNSQSAQSSDDSESDNNRWAPRSRRSRSRSKSSDRKYRNNGINGQIR